MKQLTITFCLILFLCSCSNDKKEPEASAKTEKALVASASTSTASTSAVPDSATVAKNWKDYMTPGKEHELLKNASGHWVAEITMWMAPGAPPVKTTGIEESKMILGGLYQEAHIKSSFGGMPFEGRSVMAFDNQKKMYLANWIDNMGSGMMNMEGTWDDATRSITLLGKCVDPGTRKENEMRQIIRIIDNDHHFVEMYCNGPDGKEYKTMEISYSRKPGK